MSSRTNGHKPYVPPPPEKLTYQADGLDVVLTIARANGSIGTYRTMLMNRVDDEEKALARDLSDERQLGEYLIHKIVFPSLIAATVEAKGFHRWPITFDEYLQLPEPLLIVWEEKVFALNPHWRPKPPEEANAQPSDAEAKKAPSSEPG